MEKKNKREKIDRGTDQQYIFIQALIYTCIYAYTNTDISIHTPISVHRYIQIE